MRRRTVAAPDEVGVGQGGSTLGVVRRAVGTWPRRWLLAATMLLGLTAAALLVAVGRPADRTFAGLSAAAQSLMSLLTPLFGILLAHDLKRTRPARVTPTLLAVALLAVAVGAFGVLVCAGASTVAAATADPGRGAGSVAVGSVLVQVTAVLVGTGLGLSIRSAVVAFLATIVLPLGLWWVLGGSEVRDWVTPYATVRNLLSGRASAVTWAQWLVVFLIWGVGLNAVGLARPGRRPFR